MDYFKDFDNFLDNIDLIDFIQNADFTLESELKLEKEIKLMNPILNSSIKQKSNYSKKKIICCYNNCNKYARYGLEKRKPLTCRLHKLSIYYDVLSKLCKYPDCKIQPSFGYPNSSSKYCKTHSSSDMINLKNTKKSYKKINV